MRCLHRGGPGRRSSDRRYHRDPSAQRLCLRWPRARGADRGNPRVGAGAELRTTRRPATATPCVGTLRFRTLDTPGHAPEHVSFAVANTSRADEPFLLLTGAPCSSGLSGGPTSSAPNTPAPTRPPSTLANRGPATARRLGDGCPTTARAPSARPGSHPPPGRPSATSAGAAAPRPDGGRRVRPRTPAGHRPSRATWLECDRSIGRGRGSLRCSSADLVPVRRRAGACARSRPAHHRCALAARRAGARAGLTVSGRLVVRDLAGLGRRRRPAGHPGR